MEEKIYKHPYFGEIYYLLDIPEKYKNTAGAPLLVFLHGAGERGKDHELLYRQGPPRYIREGIKTVDAITLCPQCPTEYIWNDIVIFLKDLIDSIIGEYQIDRTRVSLTGISMGGYGTWEMAMCYPEMFRKIAPVCGGGTPWRAGLIQAKIRAFHGDKDEIVPPESSYQMVDAALNAGKDASLTIFHHVNHGSWDPAYLTTNVLDWLTED